MTDDEKPGRLAIARLGLVVLVLLTPFLPLIISFAEGIAFKTNRVEGFFKHIGIHDELSLLYEPVVNFLKGI